MRPRPEGRGEPRAVPVGRSAADAASMRPRPEGRGEPKQTVHSGGTTMRSFNAATARRPWRTRTRCAGRRAPNPGFNAATARRPWRTGRRHGAALRGHASFNAATARRPWRTRSTLPDADGLGAASMRPRPEGRGEPHLHRPVRRTQYQASMRPRPEGRGEHRASRSDTRPRPHGFNAATARRPWRTRLSRRLPSASANCFNAATARRPWRTLTHARQATTGTERFNAATARRPWRTVIEWPLVRCGRPCFNAATARRPWRTRWTMASVPVTDGGFNAATARRPWRTSALRPWKQLTVCKASMRPRPEGRGERPVPATSEPARASASMRPRPEGRGERGRDQCCRLTPSRFNAATARRPWRTARGLNGSTLPQTRFNAATARRPWRTALTPAGRERRLRLQCGHGPKAVENTMTHLAARWHYKRASMRPRPEGRGELELLWLRVTQIRKLQCGHSPKAVENPRVEIADGQVDIAGFNAATARRPWRTRRSREPGPYGTPGLQCGHSPKAVENT